MRLEDLTLTQASSEIRSGKLSPVEYTRHLVDRIEATDATVKAWQTVDRDRALIEAAACEREARDKNFRGPLHGVPIGVKDIFYTKGLRTTAGSRLFQDFIPDHDAVSVAALRAKAMEEGRTDCHCPGEQGRRNK